MGHCSRHVLQARMVEEVTVDDDDEVMVIPGSGGGGGGRHVFALAGFLACPPAWPEGRMASERSQVVARIRALGGAFVDTDEWRDDVTIVVAFVINNREGLSEKVMAAVAAGRWVVTRRFVDRSHRAGRWLAPAPFAFPREQVLRWRGAVASGGEGARMFVGMRAAFILSDERRAGVYRRIVAAGGGRVLGDWTSLAELLARPPTGTEQLTHLILDPWGEGEAPPAVTALAAALPGLHMVHYKFLFHTVRGTPGTSEQEWRVEGERARAEARKRARRAESEVVEMVDLEESEDSDVETVEVLEEQQQ